MKQLLLGFVLLTGSAHAKEGGNGGGSHYCPTRSFQEVYDVYEGFNRYNIKPSGAKLSMAAHIERALKRLKNANFEVGLKVEEALTYLMKEDHFLVRANLKLERIQDANILVTDHGCSYTQLANWDDVSGNVLVDGRIFSKLDELNKAALYIHEAVYKVARDQFRAENSDEVRKIVAHAMSAGSYDFEVFYKTPIKVVQNPRPESYEFKENTTMTPEEALTRYKYKLMSPESTYSYQVRTVKEVHDLRYHNGNDSFFTGDFELTVRVKNNYLEAVTRTWDAQIEELTAKMAAAQRELDGIRISDIAPTKYEAELERIAQFRYEKKYKRLFEKAQKLKTVDEQAGKPSARMAARNRSKTLRELIDSTFDLQKLMKTMKEETIRKNAGSREYKLEKDYILGNSGDDYLTFDLAPKNTYLPGGKEEDFFISVTVTGMKKGGKVFETVLRYDVRELKRNELIFVNLNLSQNPLR